jgi:hypothetical protein
MDRHPFLSDAQREAIETAHFDLDDREIALERYPPKICSVSIAAAIPTASDSLGNPVPEDVIPRLSPLGWEHITFTGSYHWREHASDINVLRPLRTFKLLDKKRKTA